MKFKKTGARGGDMELPFEVGKRVEELAAEAFEEAKRVKKKLRGVEEAITHLQHKKGKKEKEQRASREEKKAYWFMRFRWLLEEKFLLIAGKSAEQNELIIKKYMRKEDLVFHTELPGSPFGLYRGEKDEASLQEAADFIASTSRAWKEGLSSLSVFYVKPEQVSKHARAGEYLGKGSFMIYGEKTFLTGSVKAYLHLIFIRNKPYVMLSPCRENAFATLTQGRKDTGVIARDVRNWLADRGVVLSTDEIISILPPGPGEVVFTEKLKKEQRRLPKEWV